MDSFRTSFVGLLLHGRWLVESASYKDLKGNPYTTPYWQIILHVVNHGTHHCGQVSGFQRSLGHAPPPLDLMAYYRER